MVTFRRLVNALPAWRRFESWWKRILPGSPKTSSLSSHLGRKAEIGSVGPHIVYITPTCRPYGGTRIIFQHAEGLRQRGYRVSVVGPDPAPEWYPYQITYIKAPLDQPGMVPASDICIGTFWNTVESAYRSGSRYVFHLCQGFEGVHKEYASILPQIDAVYQLPIPKLLISAHLEPVLMQRYGCRCYLLGQAVDSSVFTPGDFRSTAHPLRIGVVGPFAVRSKGIPELLRGLALARQAGYAIEVHRASIDPLSHDETQLGVTDHFFENLDTEGMIAFYRRLDALFYSSYDEEGFPLPPLEAMACGVPVALTQIRPFAVLPDAAVLRFPPGDPEAVVPVIAALTDSTLRRSLREAGLHCALTCKIDKVLDRLEAAFCAEEGL
ncbi:MAG: glycosyltransferase family 4 protein [Candidatus Binatia bacterium]